MLNELLKAMSLKVAENVDFKVSSIVASHKFKKMNKNQSRSKPNNLLNWRCCSGNPVAGTLPTPHITWL